MKQGQLRALVAFCAAACVATYSTFAENPSATISPPPTYLIIHSYDPEYRWTELINDGMMSKIRSTKSPKLVFSEYLDWKRFPSEKNILRLKELYREKYRGTRIDVILTSDDKALEFAVQNRKELFSNAPIVFSGVYPESAQRLTGGESRVTGVYEEQDIETTLQYALAIQPKAQTLYIVSDLNESGQDVERHIRKTMAIMRPNMAIWSLSQLSVSSIERNVEDFDERDIVCVGTYSIDRSGRIFTGETLIGRIALASGTPIYVLNTHQLGTGAIGGHLLSPEKMGENASGLAAMILSGVSPDSIKPLSGQSFAPTFDWDAIRRFNVDVRRLPKDSLFINREIPFFERYRLEAMLASAVIASLIAIVIILLLTAQRARRLSASVARQNREILTLNASVFEADSELKQRFDEINRIKNELAVSEERYRLSSIGSNDSLWDWDNVTQEVQYSARWSEITGYPETAGKQVKLTDILHKDDKPRYDSTLADHMEGRAEHFQCEVRIRTANGDWKWVLIRGKAVKDDKGRAVRVAGSITDIDDTKRKEERIENLAYYDQLTSLPNKEHAIETARETIENADADSELGLMIIDIDNFKYVNDTYGHMTGDKILVRTAQILSSFMTEHISVARFGGDEFIALVSQTSAQEMEKYARLAMALLGRKMEIDGRSHFMTISAGIALYPSQSSDFSELLRKADAALHRAKQTGKTRYVLFDDSIQKDLVRRTELENGLRNSIENGEITVAYQPQVNLASGKTIGFEALARWNSRRFGAVSPGEFIPIAEESGQIAKIGFYVLRAAARFIKEAQKSGFEGFNVSVNVSVKQLRDDGFARDIVDILREEGVPHGRVALEITESFMIENLAPIAEKLASLKAAGFSLSLDDFGKGYSSLSYLKGLPIDYIKIDKAFIDDITETENGRVLVNAIVSLSHRLGFTVVAEGVEDAAQVALLRDYGCDMIQGYYYAKPMADDLALAQLEKTFP